MKEIKLTNGVIAQIDDEDYETVSKHGWYCRKGGKTYYAITATGPRRNKTWFYMHQLIMGTIGKGLEVDHKDHNGLNNQRYNLSIVSHSDQIKNRLKHRGTSKYIGVSLHLYNRWLARININGKQKHIGVYTTELEAAEAYNKAAIATGNPYYQINNL